MKRTLLLLLFFSTIANAQINFTDPALKAVLLSASPDNSIAFTESSYPNGVAIDTDADGEIQQSEALLITRIQMMSGFAALNLEGMQYFTNLEEFRINGGVFSTNDITPLNQVKRLLAPLNSLSGTLDISTFSQLEEIDVSAGNLNSIITGTLPNLKVLKVGANYLSGLDVSGVPNLTVLHYSDNDHFSNFTPPDVSGLIHLTELGCSRAGHTNLNVAPLVNLTKLFCSYNQINTLNVSTLIHLKELHCSNNGLTSIDVSMMPDLEVLDVSTNPIATLDIAMLSNLTELNCMLTSISGLDTMPFTHLKRLTCGNGSTVPFNSLTLTPSLEYLFIYGYSQTDLPLHLPLLKQLDIRVSSLVTIDYSACPLVEFVTFMQNTDLEYLNSKNGNPNAILNPSITYSPNLLMICTNEPQVDIWSFWITAEINDNNPDAQVNSYCSFTPGGLYNTITGKIRFDNEGDGCDAGDVVFPYTKVTLNDGVQSGITLANPSGNYTFYTQAAGTFSLTAEVENPSYFTISPAPATVNLATIDGSVTTADFCITANGIHPDAEITIVPLGQARPGFDANYKLIYHNKGNQTISGWISVNFDDARTDFVSSNAGMSQTGNTLVFGYANLAPFETRSADFTINLNSPMELPALNQDDILDFNATLHYDDVNGNVYNQHTQLHQIVVNSLDPNDKTCLEGNTISPEMIGNYVHYNINFENIGSAEAINIVVKDEIDTAKFEISTLQVIYASHPVVTRIVGNRVDFIFENINLPGISGENKGNVMFKIKTKATLALGNSISNKANIFFDYNFPIETNEATSTFAVLKNKGFTVDATIGIAPNPATHKVSVKADSNIKSIQLFDIQGRILQDSSENSKQVSIDLSGKQNGIYFLNVTTEKGSKTEKLIKE